jgi:predicted transcriptional regulator
MELHFTPEQETQLAKIASQEGTDAQRLVKEAALRLLEEDARFRAAVHEGVAQADRGEFIEQQEMDARLEQMLHARKERANSCFRRCPTSLYRVKEQSIEVLRIYHGAQDRS